MVSLLCFENQHVPHMKCKIEYIHVNIMRSINSACLDNRSRVEMVGAHAVDNQLCSLRKSPQFLRSELNSQDLYNKCQLYGHSQIGSWDISPGAIRSGFNFFNSVAILSIFCNERPARAHFRSVGRCWTICSAQNLPV